MTQKEKQMLLTDLCARLPYGVKVLYWHHKNGGAERRVGELVNIDLRLNCDELVFRINQYYFESDSIATSKPYLRPMSSMTDEEKKTFAKLKQMSVTVIIPNHATVFRPDYIVDLDDGGDDLNSLYDWLNANHFDYRGLIEKGLALEAPVGMYKTE